MFLYDWFMGLVTFTDPSEYESYYEDTNYKTFILDERIWNHLAHKRPGIGYYRELQVCFQQLREELSNSLLFDTTELIEKVRELHNANMDLERDLAVSNARILVLESQLESARSFQTQGGRKSELGLEAAANSDQERGQDNRFTNSEGLTTIQKQKLAFIMYDEGQSYDDVAAALNVSVSSARSYISTARQQCEVRTFADGSKVYGWKGKYNAPDHDIRHLDISAIKPLKAVKNPLNNPLKAV